MRVNFFVGDVELIVEALDAYKRSLGIGEAERLKAIQCNKIIQQLVTRQMQKDEQSLRCGQNPERVRQGQIEKYERRIVKGNERRIEYLKQKYGDKFDPSKVRGGT